MTNRENRTRNHRSHHRIHDRRQLQTTNPNGTNTEGQSDAGVLITDGRTLNIETGHEGWDGLGFWMDAA